MAFIVLASGFGGSIGLAETPSTGIEPRGPFFASEFNPLYELFLMPEPRSALDESSGFQVDLHVVGASIFDKEVRKDYEMTFDLERYSINAVLSHSIDPLAIGVKVGGHYNSQGIFDGLINGFHSTFGLNSGGRDLAETNVYSLSLIDRRTNSTIYQEPPGWHVKNPVLFAVCRFGTPPSSAHAYAVAIDFKPALNSSWRKYAGHQASVGVLYGFAGKRYALNVNAAAVRIDARGALAHYSEKYAAALMAALERRLLPRCNVAVQVYYTSPYVNVPGIKSLEQGPMTLSIGFFGWTKKRMGYQLSFSEDLLAHSPSVDISLNAGLSWGQ